MPNVVDAPYIGVKAKTKRLKCPVCKGKVVLVAIRGLYEKVKTPCPLCGNWIEYVKKEVDDGDDA